MLCMSPSSGPFARLQVADHKLTGCLMSTMIRMTSDISNTLHNCLHVYKRETGREEEK